VNSAESRFANHLFAGPWTAPEIERHEGYARDHFKILLNRPTPPPDTGNMWRALERCVWWMWRAFTLQQLQLENLASAEGVK
jgi:hypothetical protein